MLKILYILGEDRVGLGVEKGWKLKWGFKFRFRVELGKSLGKRLGEVKRGLKEVRGIEGS